MVMLYGDGNVDGVMVYGYMLVIYVVYGDVIIEYAWLEWRNIAYA